MHVYIYPAMLVRTMLGIYAVLVALAILLHRDD